jgi:hypothetical protein
MQKLPKKMNYYNFFQFFIQKKYFPQTRQATNMRQQIEKSQRQSKYKYKRKSVSGLGKQKIRA